MGTGPSLRGRVLLEGRRGERTRCSWGVCSSGRHGFKSQRVAAMGSIEGLLDDENFRLFCSSDSLALSTSTRHSHSLPVSAIRGAVCGRRKDKARPGVEPLSLILEGFVAARLHSH